MNLDDFGWKLVGAIFVTAPVVGRILDAALYRIYTPKLKDQLFTAAILFDGVSFAKMFHQNARHSIRTLRRVFGKGMWSNRMALLSSCSYGIGQTLFFSVMKLRPLTAAISVGLLGTLTLCAGQLSLHITKKLLLCVRPTLFSFFLWVMLDAVLAVYLGTLPILLIIRPWLDNLPCNPLVAILFLLLLPLDTAVNLVQGTLRGDLTAILLLLVAGFSAVPLLFHVAMVLRDVLLRLFVKPSAKLLSGLFEYVSEEKNPMTWIATIAGALPAVVKAWSEVL